MSVNFLARLACAALLSIASTAAGYAAQQPPNGPATVFRHVSVLPMDRNVVLPDQVVVVRGDRIAVVQPDREGASPYSGREIDGRGLVLMPGLVDFHAHTEGWEEMPAFVAAGVTTIATLGGETLTGRWREGGDLPRPNQIASSDTLDGNPPTNRRFHSIDVPNVGKVLDQERARGAAFIKTYSKLKDPARSALLAAARERGLTVVGHIPQETDLGALFAAGFGMVAHGEEYLKFLEEDSGPARIAEIAALTAKGGVAVTPNLVGYVAMPRHATQLPEELSRPGVSLLNPAVYQEWLPRRNRYSNRPKPEEFAANSREQMPILQRLTKALHDRGALILAGTDAPVICLPGSCLHDEIALLANSGLGNYEALRSATVNAGLFEGRIRNSAPGFGTVRPGMRADLILVGADPRQDLARLADLRGTMVAGRWWTSAELRKANEEIAHRVAPGHCLVDRYEELVVGKDLSPLFAFLDREVRPRSETLNLNVMIFDALILEHEGRRADAIGLLEHGAPAFRSAPGLWNVLGRMKAESGDVSAARAAYRRALADQPWNAVALAAIAALDERPARSSGE